MKFLNYFFVFLFSLNLSQVYASSNTKTCKIKVVNCHKASEPSSSSAHMIACAYDYGDPIKAFAENVKSVLKGESKTVSCTNKGGKCDLFINAGNKLGDLTLAFCFGINHIEINDSCPSTVYTKFNNNLFGFGLKTNYSGCGSFNF